MKKVIFLLTITMFVLTGCKSEKEIKQEKIIQKFSKIIASIKFNDFSGYEISSLRSEIEGIEEFLPLDSVLNKMEETDSYNVFYDPTDCPVDIKIYAKGPSSVSGWEVSFNITNKSEKVVKYVYLTVEAKNTVDDVVRDEFGTRCKWTGPLNPKQSKNNGLYWTLYLGSQINRKSFTATDVKVEFMDGSVWPESNDNSKMLHEIFNRCNKAYMN